MSNVYEFKLTTGNGSKRKITLNIEASSPLEAFYSMYSNKSHEIQQMLNSLHEVVITKLEG